MTIHLPGPGPNALWNVHLALEDLQGLQSATMTLIKTLDDHLAQQRREGAKPPDMLGNTAAAVLLAAFATEIALKTLHAQLKPNQRPPSGHDLVKLYDALDSDTKAKVQDALVSLDPLGAPNWIGGDPKIGALVEQGRTNFVDWRYLPESDDAVGKDGVPKALVNVVQALRKVCVDRLSV